MSINSHIDLSSQVAELLIVRASGHAFDIQRNYPLWELSNKQIQRLLKVGVGGVIFFGGTSIELQHRCQTIKKWTAKPLLLCADIEEGLGQRFPGGTWFVPPIALGRMYAIDPERAMKLAESYGCSTGSQARKCGLNWVLAPVCDVNTNPSNPVINVRAWGEDPVIVSELTCAFHKGLVSQGVLSCAKHFPGHGDSSVDSHLDLPTLTHDRNRLTKLELVPFKEVIVNGVSAVMTGHLLLRNLDPKNPASLSQLVINQLLRKQLGFDGLVVTDALVMHAISNKYGAGEAAVMAFEAGSDLILMPENPDEAIKEICKALRSGRIPMERLHEALERRQIALENVERFFPASSKKLPNVCNEELQTNDDKEIASELILKTLEVLNPGGIKAPINGINLLRIDSMISCPFITNNSPSICLPESAGFKSIVSHKMTPSIWTNDINSPLDLNLLGEKMILLQLFIRGNPFVANSYDQEPWEAAIRQLQYKKLLAGLVVFGSPYIWDSLIKVLDSSIPAAYSPGQMLPAQREALSKLIMLAPHSRLSQSDLPHAFTD